MHIKPLFLPQILITVGLIFSSSPSVAQETFTNSITTQTKPWSHENFDTNANKFTFAIHSDLTGGERERVFEIAMAQLAILRPEFIISVGDLTEGGEPTKEALIKQWESYDQRIKPLQGPLFYVGGNHDLSSELEKTVWAQRNGPSYYAFRYRDVLFMVLDTEDNTSERMEEINALRNKAVSIFKSEGQAAFEKTEYALLPERTAGSIGEEQAAYFRETIRANEDVNWTFLFIHKPAWQRDDAEGFFSLETALSERPYTVFTGHVHAYEYLERHGRDYIQLATTGGGHFEEFGVTQDHVTLVTVDAEGADIANLMLSGIRDKTGNIPLDGNDVCFSVAECGEF